MLPYLLSGIARSLPSNTHNATQIHCAHARPCGHPMHKSENTRNACAGAQDTVHFSVHHKPFVTFVAIHESWSVNCATAYGTCAVVSLVTSATVDHHSARQRSAEQGHSSNTLPVICSLDYKKPDSESNLGWTRQYMRTRSRRMMRRSYLAIFSSSRSRGSCRSEVSYISCTS